MNKLVKFAILMPSNKRNGGNRVLRAIYKALYEANYNARLIEVKYGESSETANNASIANDEKRISIIFYLWALVKQAIKIGRDQDIHYVILSDPIQAIMTPLYRKKVIRYVQSDDYALFEQNASANLIIKFFYKILFLVSQNYKYEKLIFNSQVSAYNYKKTLLSYKKNINHVVVYPPVFTTDISRKHTFASCNQNKVAVITSSHPRKGFWRLSKIINETVHCELLFLVISQSDFNYNNSRVTYTKPRNDEEYIEALISCKYILNLSSFEGFGLPILEAMGLGLLPLSIINDGLREIYDPNIIKIFETTKEFDDSIAYFQGLQDILRFQLQAIAFVDNFSVDKFNEKIISNLVENF